MLAAKPLLKQAAGKKTCTKAHQQKREGQISSQ